MNLTIHPLLCFGCVFFLLVITLHAIFYAFDFQSDVFVYIVFNDMNIHVCVCRTLCKNKTQKTSLLPSLGRWHMKCMQRTTVHGIDECTPRTKKHTLQFKRFSWPLSYVLLLLFFFKFLFATTQICRFIRSQNYHRSIFHQHKFIYKILWVFFFVSQSKFSSFSWRYMIWLNLNFVHFSLEFPGNRWLCVCHMFAYIWFCSRQHSSRSIKWYSAGEWLKFAWCFIMRVVLERHHSLVHKCILHNMDAKSKQRPQHKVYEGDGKISLQFVLIVCVCVCGHGAEIANG